MEPSTRRFLARLATFAAAALGTLIMAYGLFILWFTTAWSDAFGTEPELVPGFVLIGIGSSIIVTMIFIRSRRRRSGPTR